MIAMNKFSIKGLLAGALLAFSFGQASAAVEVAGVKFDDTTKVAGKELVLNGAGVRSKFIVKVYAAGLYLQEKETTVEGVLKAEGPRRMRLVMLRDITSDDFGNAFMSGLNNNVDKNDKTKITPQISKFGEIFAQFDALKKGDVLDLDWTPGAGTQCLLNGKKVGDLIPDMTFYNSVLRIWLGEKPADASLKPKLLAQAPKK